MRGDTLNAHSRDVARLFGASDVRRCKPGLVGAVLLLALACGFAVLIAVGGSPAVAAKEYSAYSDREKTALSYLLSDPANVRDFQESFALGDGEMETILAAVRKENGILAREYAESERVVQANKRASAEKVRSEIAASDYDEQLRKAVAATKDTVEQVVSKGRRDDLETWTDQRWRAASTTALQSDRSSAFQAQATKNGVTFRVFATQYIGYTNYEVALPHRNIKFDGGFRVRLNCRLARCTGPQWAPVKEVGPWNTYDNYWMPARYRTQWKNLRRGVPEARAAYFNNYNGGKDESGREVLNPSGIDLTPAVARRLGLAKYQNTYLYVYFPWVRA